MTLSLPKVSGRSFLWFVSLLVFIQFGISGCAQVQIELPELSLDLGYTGPTMKSITVQNGAGETLYEGDPDEVSADPPPDKLDGTINITEHWSDGSKRKYKVTHTPNKPVKIGWDSDLRRYEVDSGDTAVGTAAGFFGGIAGAVASHAVSQAAVGTVVTPEDEKGIAKNDKRVTGTGVTGEVGYNFGKIDRFDGLRLSLKFDYSQGDDQSSATEPAGGNTVANTYHVNNPINGSTGVGLGATGADASSKLDYSEHSFRGKLEADFPLTDGVTLTGGASAIYSGSWQTASGSFQSLGFAGVSSTNDQELDDHYYGAGLNSRLTFGMPNGFSIFAGGGIDLLYRDATLWSAQHNLCDVCPAAEQNFTSEVEDNDSGMTYGLNLETGVTMKLNGWDIGVGAGLDFIGARTDLKNRENPSQPETHLDEKAALDWRFSFGARIHF